jgi:putative transposase
MPRRPRLELPGVPLHFTHRGVNRAATFIDDDDFHHYRILLRDVLAEHQVALHAYVLMTNHVHLLVTPPACGRLSAAMCQLGRRYVPAFNRRHRRTGTLWEGRFKSCLVESDRYALAVQRYIELNPVRAAMTDTPPEYRWSSVRASLGLEQDFSVAFHDAYLQLGSTPSARATAYGVCLRQAVAADEAQAIRMHLQQERALGDPRFQAMVEKTLNRSVALRAPGRPRITTANALAPPALQTVINSGPI